MPFIFISIENELNNSDKRKTGCLDIKRFGLFAKPLLHEALNVRYLMYREYSLWIRAFFEQISVFGPCYTICLVFGFTFHLCIMGALYYKNSIDVLKDTLT